MAVSRSSQSRFYEEQRNCIESSQEDIEEAVDDIMTVYKGI